MTDGSLDSLVARMEAAPVNTNGPLPAGKWYVTVGEKEYKSFIDTVKKLAASEKEDKAKLAKELRKAVKRIEVASTFDRTRQGPEIIPTPLLDQTPDATYVHARQNELVNWADVCESLLELKAICTPQTVSHEKNSSETP